MLKLALAYAGVALALVLSSAKVIVAAEFSLLTVCLLATALGLMLLAASAKSEQTAA